MKTPSVNYEDDPAYIERFIMESWIGKRVHSPHVVKTIDLTRKKSMLYYLMEFIHGITLEQWIKENPKRPVEEARYLIEQIAKGIRAFHRQEMPHQDLKPGNIMIDRDGIVKIIDFGSCYSRGIAEIATPMRRDRLLGTASYSAPEQVLNGPISTQSDIFAFAVIVFEMLTGQLPFEGKLDNCRTQEAYHANPKYKKYEDVPLAVRNPVLLWQVISAILFVALCVTTALLITR